MSEITPVSRPERRAPGSATADTAGKAFTNDGEAGTEPLGDERTACGVAGVARGVAGVDGDGDWDSTTHIRWALVATILATVCAKVD